MWHQNSSILLVFSLNLITSTSDRRERVKQAGDVAVAPDTLPRPLWRLGPCEKFCVLLPFLDDAGIFQYIHR